MQSNIKSTLLEARKAYRYLYDYQKRILDLISFISGKYSFNYKGGWPKFSANSPKNGKGNLGLWAWDWLNLYFYEFNFETKIINNENIYFSIFVLNDTGYYDALNVNGADKIDTNSFTSVEDSESKLIFVAGKNMWMGWGANWDLPEFLNEKYGRKMEEENKLMIFKHYSLENFENEEKAMAAIKDFEQLCQKNNIQINIKTTILQ